MAISKEDKKDVKKNFGKALANKVADATRDYSGNLQKGGRKVYPSGGFGKDKTESYSNIRKSVTNFNKDYKGSKVAGHMRDNFKKTHGPVEKSIARNEDKAMKNKAITTEREEREFRENAMGAPRYNNAPGPRMRGRLQ